MQPKLVMVSIFQSIPSEIHGNTKTKQILGLRAVINTLYLTIHGLSRTMTTRGWRHIPALGIQYGHRTRCPSWDLIGIDGRPTAALFTVRTEKCEELHPSSSEKSRISVMTPWTNQGRRRGMPSTLASLTMLQHF